ncbi:sugar phosphate isomerase/epimerase family protein [Pleomorphovibrio marinus]|uniref:sugar phosphate isomerase/epimerase family protein n=1 Tax=Pleomorphovibrio marinus TaxID=2164132 RepID=UPI0013009AF5|nr:TIM barrel protein [Pleomorphovibrio marinus]
MKLGISSYTYTWSIGVGNQIPPTPMGAYDLIHTAKGFGLSKVQLADNIPLHHWPQEELQQLSQQAQQLGVELEVGARGLTSQRLEKYLGIAKTLGSPFLRFVIDEGEYEPSHDEIVKVINDGLNALREAKISLAIENHDRFHCKELIQLIHQTDPTQVGICLDSVNSLGAGEGIQEVLEQLIPLSINFHIKDFTIQRHYHQMGFEVTGTVAGEGFLDIPGIVKKLKHFRRCHSCTLELWTPPEENLEGTIRKEQEWAKKSIHYLQSLEAFE